MRFDQLLQEVAQSRIGYLVDVLNATVSEALESPEWGPQSIERTLSVFSLTDVERITIHREAIERLRKV